MSKCDGTKLKGRWAFRYDRCQDCGTNERPHMAKGLCNRCYENALYRLNKEREHVKRKADRIARGTVEQRYQKVRAWHAANAGRVKAYKADWHKRNGPQPLWPIGLEVRVLVGKKRPIWVVGTIIERPSRGSAWVQFAGNRTVLVSVAKRARIMTLSDWALSNEIDGLALDRGAA